jgi:hypothetical protein
LLVLVAVLIFGVVRAAVAQGLRKIHAAIPSISPSSTVFVIARERGYYREKGSELVERLRESLSLLRKPSNFSKQ